MESNSISHGGINAGALSAFSQAFQAHAHNVANISTDKYKQITPVLADGPGGWGVRLSSLAMEGEPLRNGEYSSALEPGETVPSGTQVAYEFPSMMIVERAFQANAQSVRVTDEMLGSLFDSIA